MEITPRQYGRLEVAAWALRKHAERNDVCTVLCDSITEVLDEIASEDTLDELRRERFPWPEDSATESGADPASPEGYAVASGQKGGAEVREARCPRLAGRKGRRSCLPPPRRGGEPGRHPCRDPCRAQRGGFFRRKNRRAHRGGPPAGFRRGQRPGPEKFSPAFCGSGRNRRRRGKGVLTWRFSKTIGDTRP